MKFEKMAGAGQLAKNETKKKREQIDRYMDMGSEILTNEKEQV